jgi:thiosulfate dehydrogenase (quinone) large subunit
MLVVSGGTYEKQEKITRNPPPAGMQKPADAPDMLEWVREKRGKLFWRMGTGGYIYKASIKEKKVMSQQQNAFVKWGALVLMVVAGAWTLFHLIWNFAAQTSDDAWGTALLILFLLALILAFVQFFQQRATLKAVSSTERFPEPAIVKFFFASEGSAAIWFVVRMEVGAEWLLAGWEKIKSPSWGTSGKAIAGFVAGALAKASGPNPAVQGWYVWFLQHAVQPNAAIWSFLITYGEFAVGLGILLGILTGIAAGFGVLMNLNYLLAGTVSINPILGMFGLFLVFSWRVCGWIGGDRLLLPALGLPWQRGSWFHATAESA